MIKVGDLNFKDWYAREFCDGDLELAGRAISRWSESLLREDAVHDGDCTKSSQPCNMCILETILADYYNYTFGISEE